MDDLTSALWIHLEERDTILPGPLQQQHMYFAAFISLVVALLRCLQHRRYPHQVFRRHKINLGLRTVDKQIHIDCALILVSHADPSVSLHLV